MSKTVLIAVVGSGFAPDGEVDYSSFECLRKAIIIAPDFHSAAVLFVGTARNGPAGMGIAFGMLTRAEGIKDARSKTNENYARVSLYAALEERDSELRLSSGMRILKQVFDYRLRRGLLGRPIFILAPSSMMADLQASLRCLANSEEREETMFVEIL